MFHTNTERLIDYWRARKTGATSPTRAAIDPIALSTLLPQVFILGRLGPGRHVFRLAGGLIGDLHQRDLRQADFLELWSQVDRLKLASAMEVARRGAEPLVIAAEARSAVGATVCLEVLLAPIHAGAGEPERTIGLYQPTSMLAALDGQAIVKLSVLSVTTADGAMAQPALRLAAVGGRLIA